MPIDFSQERWDRVKQNARDWWNGKLGRPLIQMTLTGRSPGRPKPEPADLSCDISYDLSVTPEEIVDRWDYELSGYEFLGDAFPCFWPNFGAGVLATYMGAKVEPTPNTIWFLPDKDRELSDIHFSITPDNAWLERVKDIYRSVLERWNGLVQVGMTDLGGTLDILSTFRPGDKLLTDLVDSPDEVKRLAWEVHAMWWRAFDEINAVLRPGNPGYTAWAPIFSETSYCMLQCDFCYMIGPKMFDEFVKPELAASCKKLDHAFYHLDGPGELPHLDSLLEIKELKGVQWIPGSQNPHGEAWPEVYRKILKAGKRVQFYGDWRNFGKLVDQVGGAENFVVFASAPVSQRREAEDFLKRYGAR